MLPNHTKQPRANNRESHEIMRVNRNRNTIHRLDTKNKRIANLIYSTRKKNNHHDAIIYFSNCFTVEKSAPLVPRSEQCKPNAQMASIQSLQHANSIKETHRPPIQAQSTHTRRTVHQNNTASTRIERVIAVASRSTKLLTSSHGTLTTQSSAKTTPFNESCHVRKTSDISVILARSRSSCAKPSKLRVQCCSSKCSRCTEMMHGCALNFSLIHQHTVTRTLTPPFRMSGSITCPNSAARIRAEHRSSKFATASSRLCTRLRHCTEARHRDEHEQRRKLGSRCRIFEIRPIIFFGVIVLAISFFIQQAKCESSSGSM